MEIISKIIYIKVPSIIIIINRVAIEPKYVPDFSLCLKPKNIFLLNRSIDLILRNFLFS